MTMIGRVLLAVVIPLLVAPGARAACTSAECSDETAITVVRSRVADACNCATVKTHKQYVRCAKQVIKGFINEGKLPRTCAKTVGRCEAQSTCGLRKAAVCCALKNGVAQARMIKRGGKCAGTPCKGAMVLVDACTADAKCVPPRQGVRSFRSVQAVFTQSCALPSCHSTFARKGGLVLESEDVSYASLVERHVDGLKGRLAVHPDAKQDGLLRVKPGDPVNSYLVRKLRGQGPGDTMPQAGGQLAEPVIRMISDWIVRGARSTAEECAGARGTLSACSDDTVDTGNFHWQPEPPLEAPEPGKGIQLYTPPRDVDPGTEWETCYAFRPDWPKIAAEVGLEPGDLPTLKSQVYGMHKGSHHLLLYAYFGDHPEQWKLGQYFPCFAASPLNAEDGPEDSGNKLPIGGTQVAGIRYEVTYPHGVGIPVLDSNMVLIVNEHYTNPFQPPQEIHGEAWLNLYFHAPGEFQVLLDGIFAINYPGLFVEPYQSRTISSIWHPRSLLTRQPADAAVFQLFGHMHKRGTEFRIDVVRDGKCSASGALCGRDDDCTCKPYQTSCQPGQTCVLGPNHEDSTIYYTTEWDNAPVVNYPKPYFPVGRDEGLRWTCTHVNGVEGDSQRPPKRCHPKCNSCGWDDATRTCTITPKAQLGPTAQTRVYNEGDPMPLTFGELADDDMCNMFGYFIKQSAVARLP